jgi:hypothetical protein
MEFVILPGQRLWERKSLAVRGERGNKERGGKEGRMHAEDELGAIGEAVEIEVVGAALHGS